MQALAFAFASTWVHTMDMARIDVSGLGSFIRDQRDQAQMSLRQLAKAAESQIRI